MKRKSGKYTRCKNCKELVLDADNCANCAANNENRRPVRNGKRGIPTLDIQEGNDDR